MLPMFEPPAEITVARPFWDAVRRGELVLPRCSVCGAWQWYPETVGTDCAGGTLDWQPVATTGTLYSRTTIHRGFLPGGRDRVPYAVGLVDLDGVDGPRLVVPLADDTAGPDIGDRVSARFLADHVPPLVIFGPAA
jgi:uncharacterized protein